jgi:hypothetical protein
MSELVSVRQILQSPDEYSGWLYLPDPPWNLDTQGVFAEDDKDADPADDPRPNIAKINDWQEVLDSASIEDIVTNAKAQIGTATSQQLFDAFVYYFENDAFIAF